jgi:hypothetical protein
MAKKATKKGAVRGMRAGRAAKKKTSTKPAKRGGGVRSAGRAGPVMVKTGAGATPGEVGRAVVEGFNARAPEEQLWDRWWSRNAESIEGEGVSMMWAGRKALEAKSAHWLSEHTVHGASAEGPFVGATGFSVRFHMDVEEKATGARHVMEEIGVYTVKGGKIIREEFFYGPRRPVAPTLSELASRETPENLDGLPPAEVAQLRM